MPVYGACMAWRTLKLPSPWHRLHLALMCTAIVTSASIMVIFIVPPLLPARLLANQHFAKQVQETSLHRVKPLSHGICDISHTACGEFFPPLVYLCFLVSPDVSSITDGLILLPQHWSQEGRAALPSQHRTMLPSVPCLNLTLRFPPYRQL